MNTLSAQELKRRGVAALEEALRKGPVYVIKNNRPACVVLSENEYAQLGSEPSKKPSKSLWNWLQKPATGRRTRREINRQLSKERESWDKK